MQSCLLHRHTSPSALNSIRKSMLINPSRGGIHFELGPSFVNPRNANFGQFGKGAYFDITVPRSILSSSTSLGAESGIGVRIITSSPFNISRFNPQFYKWKWLW